MISFARDLKNRPVSYFFNQVWGQESHLFFIWYHLPLYLCQRTHTRHCSYRQALSQKSGNVSDLWHVTYSPLIRKKQANMFDPTYMKRENNVSE
jgi:hypothetical protein